MTAVQTSDRTRGATAGDSQPAVSSRLAAVATGGAAATYLGVVAGADPYRELTIAGATIGCPVHAVTGGFCPGCGSTRAVHELLHGDVVASLAAHPLVLPLVGLLGFLSVSWFLRQRPGAPGWARLPTELPALVPVAILVAFVTLTVVRNVPGLEWLQPPDVAP